MAPGGDFLARMFLGSELVDEVDFREKAARRARVQAGKEWRAMKAQGSAPSSSHSSSDYVSSGASSQRRDASSRRDAREVTQGHVVAAIGKPHVLPRDRASDSSRSKAASLVNKGGPGMRASQRVVRTESVQEIMLLLLAVKLPIMVAIPIDPR
ncbi:MAG: hypothetical protein LQ346_005039 [Caloplaca aetnensis]|nr:MAG: hypothetical protein LQ346_005039 [Caloplaca aetnensis]